MNTLPTGTVTFLFTDIEDSTKLWEQHPEEMKSALAKHDSILKESIASNHGHIIKTTGDGIHAAFATALDGIEAALDAQRALTQTSEVSLRVRMGLHTGEAELRDGDYYGQALNRAARIMSAGHGGQILLSEISAQLTRDEFPAHVSTLDLGEYTLRGLTRSERIFQLTAPSLQKDFPALHAQRAGEAGQHNLPVQLTSFIGRERELHEAKQRLASARLLTLIGPGGTGKTRLSIQTAHDLLADYPDGIWIVELAPISDPELIRQTVAAIFNLREQSGMPLNDVILNFLRAKRLLLILDNCEHMVEACASLAEQMLQHAPALKILASSREALGIGGEAIYRVPSLSSPPEDFRSLGDFGSLAQYESVQLFVERARAANPNFEMSDANASALAQICRRLDGIPLALELAAARVSVFSAEQIATRLDDRFKLLTGGSRTALPRQQTLRALIDWSYDILSEDEKTLLRRLSVFAGGFTFEAVESIGAELDVLDLLNQLVNKSLVITEQDNEATRYRLLETIRQYARDRLLDKGETTNARNAHLEYFLRLAEQAGPKLDGDGFMYWILKLEAEYDNFRVAFEWALDNDVESALRFVSSLGSFWFRHGHNAEGIQWALDAVARAEKLQPLQDVNAALRRKGFYADALAILGIMAYSQGDNRLAMEVSAKCLPLLRESGNDRMLGLLLGFTASARMFSGDFSADIMNLMDEVMLVTRRSGDNYSLGMALGLMSQVTAMAHKDIARAIEYDQESIRLLNESRSNWGTLMAYFSSGRGAMFRGDFATARERFAKCLPIFEEMGDDHRANMIHSEFAHMDRAEGKLDSAEAGYRKSLPVWQRLGHRAAIAHQLECFSFIAKTKEDGERAACLFGAAEILRERINIQMTAQEKIDYDREVADLKNNVDEAEFKSAWAKGRAMTMEDAIKIALG